MQHTFHSLLAPSPQAEQPNKEKNPNECCSCRLTRLAVEWHSSGVVRYWGRRGELGDSSAQTATESAVWCSLELAECCWLHDPPCCGRHWALGKEVQCTQQERYRKYIRAEGRWPHHVVVVWSWFLSEYPKVSRKLDNWAILPNVDRWSLNLG